jgi:mitochondrial inner membrane protease subunit 2
MAANSARATFLRRFSYSLFGWATWIPAVIAFNLNVAEVCKVTGASMYPFLNEDIDATQRRDLIVSYKWNAQKDLRPGMVVTLRRVCSANWSIGVWPGLHVPWD